jgi:DNA uptake protein ComE-like DNA-binding protein
MNRRRAQAMIPVLFVMLILTALAVILSGMARREMHAGTGYSRDVQMQAAARGAILLAASQLAESTTGGASPPSLTLPPDTDVNGWTMLGDVWYKVEIIDTASRVNINTASADALNRLPGFNSDPNIVAATIDWRDTDSNPSTSPNNGQGAEADVYEALVPPYTCKNAPFDTIDELLLVRGMTPAILYGESNLSTTTAVAGTDAAIQQTNPQTRQAAGGGGGQGGSPASTPPTVGSVTSTIPLAELITTYSKERNVASDGTARVNLKTCTQQQLTDIGLSAAAANSVIQNRGQNGANLNSIADLMGTPYTGFTRTFMQQNADKLTVTAGQDRPGVININSAPSEVLATIPGVDATTYQAVVDARNSGTTFTGLNDLFQLTQLNRQQLQSLVDNICTKSSVYIIRVRVRVPGSAQIYAVQALVEISAAASTTGTTGTTTSTTSTSIDQPTGQFRILQWREVGRTPGWQSWSPAPKYTATTSTTTSTSGGTLGSN